MTDENFKITLQILQVLIPKFHINSVSALCKGWLQCNTSVIQGLLTHCKNLCCRIGHSILHYLKLKSSEINIFFYNALADCCYFIIAAVSSQSSGSKAQNPCLFTAVHCIIWNIWDSSWKYSELFLWPCSNIPNTGRARATLIVQYEQGTSDWLT